MIISVNFIYVIKLRYKFSFDFSRVLSFTTRATSIFVDIEPSRSPPVVRATALSDLTGTHRCTLVGIVVSRFFLDTFKADWDSSLPLRQRVMPPRQCIFASPTFRGHPL